MYRVIIGEAFSLASLSIFVFAIGIAADYLGAR